VDQRDELLALGESQDLPRLLGLEQRRRPPVRGETARVGGEQDDVDGARRGKQVLAVLVVVPCEQRARDDERRRASELRGLVRRSRGDEPVERLPADHPEPPRLGEMVVGGQARELEDAFDRRPADRLGLVGLVRPARAGRVLGVHGRNLPAP
jgi:hypothetical protein